MNVSRNAYFTSEYLDQKTRRSPKSPGLRHSASRDTVLPTTPRTPTSEFYNGDQIDNPDELVEEITPAQLNYLAERRRRNRPHVEYYPRKEKKGSNDEYDDGIFVVNSSHNSLYTNDEDSYYEAKPKKQVKFDGYYIDQQKRFEEAEDVKPKFYTHKTFQDVFGDDEDNRFNPIDLVFDDPEKIREQEQKQKFTRAVRNVQKKMGKNDYASYDYYVQKKVDEERRVNEEAKIQLRLEKENAKREKENARSDRGMFKLIKRLKKKEPEELFVDHNSDDSDDNFVAEMGEENPMSNPGVKKTLKKKWKSAKKNLGNNYFDNYEKETNARQQIKLTIEENQAMQEAAALREASYPTPGYAGPNENFHPLWNYLLSWVVYNQNYTAPTIQNQVIEDAPPDKIVELSSRGVPNDEGNSKENTKKKRDKALTGLKTAKGVFTNWNQPASAYFAGQKISPGSKIVAVPKVNFDVESSALTTSVYPEEYEMELADGEELEDELIYNPDTGEFEPLMRDAPTSASAMFGDRTQFKNLHIGGPVRIVSNINKLIKSIKIMKIVFAPIDVIAVSFPTMQTVIILLELVIFVWILYELSLLIDALCMAVKAVCAPMIAIGKFMNRIV